MALPLEPFVYVGCTHVLADVPLVGFWIGRRILKAYEQWRRQGETRICFLKISLDSDVRTYMVGSNLWDLSRSMEAGAGRVVIQTGHEL